MKKLWKLGMEIWGKHREALAYLFFGGVSTVVNIASFWLFGRLGLSTFAANALAWVVSVLVAYVTNRIWVFQSGARGMAALREFVSFVLCRLATGVMDQVLVVWGVDTLGPKLFSAAQMEIWSLAVKVFSNILVIVANYVFSKLLIFRRKDRQ